MDFAELDEIYEDQLKGDESFDADGMGDGGSMSTEDGCIVEPDGRCPHGQLSPGLKFGLI